MKLFIEKLRTFCKITNFKTFYKLRKNWKKLCKLRKDWSFLSIKEEE